MSSLHLKNNGNQNRYTRRQEQRRKIDSLISTEGVVFGRREPTPDEVQQMKNGIEENKVSEFGLLRLSSLKLNICYDMGGEDGPCSLLRYAISRGRDKIAMALIRAGALPHAQCISETVQTFRTFRELNPQYAVWLMAFEQTRRSPSSTCAICCANQVDCVQFDTCCHKVCMHCFWVRANELDGLKSQLPQMLSHLSVWDKILDPIICCLSCGNQAYIGENGQSHQSRLLQLPSEECDRASYDLFRALPVSHVSGNRKELSTPAGQHKSKKEKTLKGMHLRELAQCNPGTTQAQRQEEFVKACMKADIRRVAALIEAGVHLDGIDEYGMTALMQSAWLGHVHVCALLIAAGADAHIQDALGHTALSIAVSTGDGDVIELLVRIHGAAEGYATEAWSEGDKEVNFSYFDHVVEEKDLPSSLCALYQERYTLRMEPIVSQNSPHQGGGNTSEHNAALSILIPPETSQLYQENVRAFWRDHGVKGAEPGAFCVDHFFEDVFLQSLLSVFTRLPVAPSEKAHCASRSYFCDVEEQFTHPLEQAIRRITRIGSLRDLRGNANTIETDESDSADSTSRTIKVFPQMRFLHYEAEGTALAPHVDLSRHDPRAVHIKSTHTFILYLTDCDAGGGETVLLKSLCAKGKAVTTETVALNNGYDDNTVAAVSPRRGRLLLFPHNCPHEGRAISSKDPKLLLRGEVYIGPC
uniref:Fe2OG dioxygenase domain-containing protein n=1 Tax=Spumella elongata TaxID=89044 RepID=A0A7S3MEH5_9STRA|mmetsp:Transcript_56638/g.99543  ORF Transcript_56638/g.99543 Transcript_56638/m.99543 type:complete len:699 (+) Transcript_56638:42-2138(+)